MSLNLAQYENNAEVSNKHFTTTFATGVSKHQSSKAWALKHLHPPSPLPDDYAGYPDNNNSGSVHSEFRLTTTVGRGTTEGKENKSALYLVAPGFKGLVYQALSAPDNHGTNRWACGSADGIGQDNNTITTDDVRQVSSTRMAYRSTTFMLNTNALTNKGTVTVGGFRPSVTAYTSVEFAAFKAAYQHHDGYSRLLTAIGWDWEDPVVVNRNGTSSHNIGIVKVGRVQVVKLNSFVNSEQQVLQSSPKSTQTLATEGAFVRQFVSQPTNRYKDSPLNSDGSDYNTYCAYEYQDSNGNFAINYFVRSDGQDPKDIGGAFSDLPWYDFRWYYVYFSGLDLASNVTIKTIAGYEMQPRINTLLNSQIHAPALPDNLCLESVSDITTVVPDSLPARFNEEGPLTVAEATRDAAGEEGFEVDRANMLDKNMMEMANKNTSKQSGRPSTPKKTRKEKDQNRASHIRSADGANHAKRRRRRPTTNKPTNGSRKILSPSRLNKVKKDADSADILIKKMKKLMR